MPTVEVVVMDEVVYPKPKGGILGHQQKDDTAGWLFDAELVVDGVNGTTTVKLKAFDPVHPIPVWSINLPNPRNQKIDGLGGFTNNNDDLFLPGYTHAPVDPAHPDDARSSLAAVWVVRGVYHPNPTAEQEGGTRVDLQGTDPTPDPGGGVTEEQVRAIVNTAAATITQNVVNNIVGLFGGNVRTGLFDKAQDALLSLLDPNNTSPKATAFRYLLRYRMVEDGAYSADMNALRDYNGKLGKSDATPANADTLSAADEAKRVAYEALAIVREAWDLEVQQGPITYNTLNPTPPPAQRIENPLSKYAGILVVTPKSVEHRQYDDGANTEVVTWNVPDTLSETTLAAPEHWPVYPSPTGQWVEEASQEQEGEPPNS